MPDAAPATNPVAARAPGGSAASRARPDQEQQRDRRALKIEGALAQRHAVPGVALHAEQHQPDRRRHGDEAEPGRTPAQPGEACLQVEPHRDTDRVGAREIDDHRGRHLGTRTRREQRREHQRGARPAQTRSAQRGEQRRAHQIQHQDHGYVPQGIPGRAGDQIGRQCARQQRRVVRGLRGGVGGQRQHQRHRRIGQRHRGEPLREEAAMRAGREEMTVEQPGDDRE